MRKDKKSKKSRSRASMEASKELSFDKKCDIPDSKCSSEDKCK